MVTKGLSPPRTMGRGSIATYIDQNPVRAAWTALICSFMVFVMLVAIVAQTATAFVRSSTQPATATLVVTQGPVSVQKARTRGWISVEDGAVISEGDEIRNFDPDFPITLTFFDTTKVQLNPGGQMFLTRVRTQRFHVFPGTKRQLSLELEAGAAHVDVPAAAPQMDVQTMGTVTRLQSGTFDLRLIPRIVDGIEQCCMSQLVVVHGLAHVLAAGETMAVSDGQRALTPMGGVTLPLQPAARELLQDGPLVPDDHSGVSSWAPWLQTEPGGTLGVISPLPAADGGGMHIVRAGTNLHGETGIRQDVNIDVHDFVSLTVKFQYRLLGQSLPGGGRDGSEYPLTVRVVYREVNGGQIPWYHGFYLVPAAAEMRVTQQATGPVPRGVWTQYEGDLLALSPRPTFIRSVEIYGSGWDYEVDITNVSLSGT